jgi:hypothetical protein
MAVCLLEATPGTLVLRAEAPDAEELARLEDVVGRHLVRFGERGELKVAWDRPA